ncbi:type I-F CRISPR-associated protein Csy3 [Aggregatibacter actinomycetemcomitans]|uniref:type I-F CRISPR-associated protein Csy3 n=1 Tax=Aggregatibacter actinomycetemcomitans TaxID=714 RepID=UPI00197BBB0A|nr:type I-F CRISPR-associated protein Csy3 [Aggregatibacter actinomycetemcomitans]MBN6069545.1 type I-F CRISPR-associated protein Csy3 [Aggregatibacter actinomycetemcomitans]MBN6086247.1 type I-F CRISPR-associated protein Csy3 [Aggregatibacter actinomycetemcomitans]
MRKLTTPTVLAFERNLDISDAVFTQFNSQDKNPVEEEVKIREKSVRGTISNRLKNTITNDPTKLDAEIQKPNLQRVDVATLNDKNDILVARFTGKVLPFDGKPCVCNDQDYQSKIISVVESYIKTQGLSELAKRYATNIANARWLWRNRMSADTIKIEVSFNGETLTFDNAKAFSLNHFDESSEELKTLAGFIEAGLSGKEFVILNVTAYAKMGYGQEVYPSQELVLDAVSNNRKSKILYEINDKAAMHSQKVSNAIRTIDTWYKPNAEFPIPTEPYGAVTTLGAAFRQPKEKLDFYTLFDNWLLNDKVPDVEQQHYVMSVLIRGGVFGASGKE